MFKIQKPAELRKEDNIFSAENFHEKKIANLSDVKV